MGKMMTEDNFVMAERLLGKNKPKNKTAKYISSHAEEFGHHLFLKVTNNQFSWHTPKERIITESYKQKERRLKIPCLEDQAVQLAWLNVATPIIERRNYYYNCGSIPGAGQSRAVRALKKWLKNPKMKYAAVMDIRKFYDSCPHSAVRAGLERIFKDKEFVEFAMGFVTSMSDNGIGIAIGYPVSHWLANVVLMGMDHELCRLFPDVRYVRYMDDMVLVSTNRRHLVRATRYVKQKIEEMGMALRKWSVFSVKDRGITFLSYRFFNGYTLMTKPLMIRISRRMIRAAANMNAHVAAGVMSYLGLLKQCDSYNFRVERVYPYINKKTCRKLISEKNLSRRKGK